ncbi:hypothetical protein QFZ40_001641 [Arthrobacter pascens]|uniref:hypothetical protein n=1 Tax=Arthrobacter pascens TaxID=1677 RepID=UPI00278083DC|nr:hypothetical protein [Arthrobacter pascens]MDQ0633732.1 hypothetical protein [Arthrobacter pascens]
MPAIVGGREFIVSGSGHGQPTNPSNRDLAAQITQAVGRIALSISQLRVRR